MKDFGQAISNTFSEKKTSSVMNINIISTSTQI